MQDTFQTYKDALAERRDTFLLDGLPTAGRVTSAAGQEMLSHFQQETKCNQALQMNSKMLQIQKGAEQLFGEVMVRD